MVNARPPTRTRTNRCNALALIEAAIFLVIVGYTIGLIFFGAGSRSTKTSIGLVANAVDSVNGGGFHNIHVYYRPENAIQELRTSSMQMKQNYQKGSQVNQDKIISALVTLDCKKTCPGASEMSQPYFIDLAANDAVQLSNTLRLKEDGWQDLCVEPNPIYWHRLAHRKCTVVGAFVGGKRNMQQVDVSLSNEEYGGIIGDQMDNSNKNDKQKQQQQQGNTQTEKRYMISLATLFWQFHVPTVVDYMSFDVEGTEELIMEDFPFDTHTICFITIERPKPGLQTLLQKHGNRFVMKLIFLGKHYGFMRAY